MSANAVLEFAREKNLRSVDLKFTDLVGRWRHRTVPAALLNEDLLSDGVAFDGSSVPGFATLEASDLKIKPDCTTMIVDPVWDVPTLSLICDVIEADSNQPFAMDPRHVAKEAEKYMVSTGIADQSYWGIELEFYILESAVFGQDRMCGYYYIESGEASTQREGDTTKSLGYSNRPKRGYHTIPPADTLYNLRAEMSQVLDDCGVRVTSHNHEVGGPGQMEFAIHHEPLVKSADNVCLARYLIKNIAVKKGKTVTFMPRLMKEEATNAMHIHQSLTRKGEPILYDQHGYAQLSETALHFIGGILKHTPALMGFVAASTNSYKRFFARSEEPTKLTFSRGNRSACIRIPGYASTPEQKHIEYRAPDSTCNIYLAVSAILMAGLDGIQRKVDPTAEGFGPFEVDVEDLDEKEKAKLKSLPTSLRRALTSLEQDHEFLTKSNVFTDDLITRWIHYKIENEVLPVEMSTHPFEYCLYYDS